MHLTITQVTGSNPYIKHKYIKAVHKGCLFYCLSIAFFYCLFFTKFGLPENSSRREYMTNRFFTDKFTLVPTSMYRPDYLSDLFDIDQQEEIKTIEIPLFNATLAFALPKNNGSQNKVPVIYTLLEHIKEIPEHNKIVVHYCKDSNKVQIVAAEGNNLLLANSFKCNHQNTLLYYITLVCQQVMFNPHLTRIYTDGQFEKSEEELLKRYFQGIKVIL